MATIPIWRVVAVLEELFQVTRARVLRRTANGEGALKELAKRMNDGILLDAAVAQVTADTTLLDGFRSTADRTTQAPATKDRGYSNLFVALNNRADRIESKL